MECERRIPSKTQLPNRVNQTYTGCSEIIETLAFYPERIDLDKQNSA